MPPSVLTSVFDIKVSISIDNHFFPSKDGSVFEHLVPVFLPPCSDSQLMSFTFPFFFLNSFSLLSLPLLTITFNLLTLTLTFSFSFCCLLTLIPSQKTTSLQAVSSRERLPYCYPKLMLVPWVQKKA